jgi:protein SCO1/2
MLKFIRWLAYGLIGVVLVGWGLVWTGVVAVGPDWRVSTTVSVPTGVAIGGPFALQDSAGKPVTDASFRGRWMLLYFGYTFCPDVCPTELQSIANAMDLLGPAAAKVAPVFITVDPARDTPGVVGEYVKLFHPDLVGLTGTQAQIDAVTRAYRVYAQKAESKATTDYLMNHSSFIYLIGPDGRFVTLFRQGTSPKDLADAILARVAPAG